MIKLLYKISIFWSYFVSSDLRVWMNSFFFFKTNHDSFFVWPGLKNEPEKITLRKTVKGKGGRARPGASNTKSLPHVRFFTLRRFYWLFYGREHCKSLHPASTALCEVAPLGARSTNYASRKVLFARIFVSEYGRSVSRNTISSTFRQPFVLG